MGVIGKLDLMAERRAQFSFNDKSENIAKANIRNLSYPKQHINI